MKTSILKIIFLMFVACVIFPSGIKAQTTTYDKGKHYQWRSMEDGPWEFSPRFYYFLFHRNYRRNYSNSNPIRKEATAATVVNLPFARSEAESLASDRDLELRLMADREIDLAEGLTSDTRSLIEEKITENLITYALVGGEDIWIFLEEYERLKEKKEVIHSSYMDNAKRKEAYLELDSELIELSRAIKSFLIIQHSLNTLNSLNLVNEE